MGLQGTRLVSDPEPERAVLVVPSMPQELKDRIGEQVAAAEAEMASRSAGGTKKQLRPHPLNPRRAEFDAVVGDTVTWSDRVGLPPARVISEVFGISLSGSYQLLRKWRDDHAGQS